MCTFYFRYADNIEHEFENIKRVEFVRSTNVIVSEEQLLTYCFPTGYDLHLFSDTNNFTVSGKNIIYIEARKES